MAKHDLWHKASEQNDLKSTCMLTFNTSRGVVARWVVPALSIPPMAQRA